MKLRTLAIAGALAGLAGLAFAQGAAQSPQAAPPQAAPCAAPPCGPGGSGGPGGPGGRHFHRAGDHDRMLKQFDTDRDGLVSRAEFQAAQQRQMEAFDKADQNADGKLSRDEMRAMREQMRPRMQGMMQEHRHGPGAPEAPAAAPKSGA